MRKIKFGFGCIGACLLAAWPPRASAQALENASGRSWFNFYQVYTLPTAALEKNGQVGSEVSVPPVKGKAAPKEGGFNLLNVAPGETKPQTGDVPVLTVELDKIYNKHLKSSLRLSLSGETVYVSGTFDREQNAFVTVWPAGAERAQIFNMAGLLDKAEKVEVGGVSYSLYLEANAIKPLRSRITFENEADEDDLESIRIGSTLERNCGGRPAGPVFGPGLQPLLF